MFEGYDGISARPNGFSGPDLRATFDYVRLRVPDGLADCVRRAACRDETRQRLDAFSFAGLDSSRG